MQKNTKIIIVGCIVTIIIISSSLYFIFIKEDKEVDPLSDLQFVNEEYNWGINPPEGWHVGPSSYVNDEPNMLQIMIRCPDYYNISALHAEFSIDSEPYSTGDLSSTVTGMLETFNNSTVKLSHSLVLHTQKTVNGMNAYEFIVVTNHSEPEKWKMIYVEKNNRFLYIRFKGYSIGAYEKYLSDFERSINTLVIV